MLGHELTPAEAIPYQAGFRIGQTQAHFHRTWDYTAAMLTPHLKLAERAALASSDEDVFFSWVLIGLQAQQLDDAVKRLKGT